MRLGSRADSDRALGLMVGRRSSPWSKQHLGSPQALRPPPQFLQKLSLAATVPPGSPLFSPTCLPSGHRPLGSHLPKQYTHFYIFPKRGPCPRGLLPLPKLKGVTCSQIFKVTFKCPLYRFVVVCCWTLGWSPWGRSLMGSFSSPSSRAFRVGVASNVSRGTRSPGSLTRPPPGSCSTQLNSIFFFFFVSAVTVAFRRAPPCRHTSLKVCPRGFRALLQATCLQV